MSTYKIFLDDVREPWDDSWTIVRSYVDFCQFVDKHVGQIEVVSFDHDLHDEHYPEIVPIPYKKYHHPTGLECANYLVNKYYEKGFKLPRVMVHSRKWLGAKNIAEFLKTKAMFLFDEFDFEVEMKPY